MDKIIVNQLRLEAIIGVYPWERETKQVLFVDMEIAQDITVAANEDDLSKTVDYAEVCSQITTLAEEGRFQLIETFAEQSCQLVLAEFDAEWVKISVSKVDALPQVSSVGIVIERSRSCTA